MIFPESVKVVRAPVVDSGYGSLERDWDNATRTAVAFGVIVQASESTEDFTVGRSPVITHMRLITPPGKDIDLLRTDRVEWGGADWDVDGEVARHKRPSTGLFHHLEATLKRPKG